MSFTVQGWCPGALRPMMSGDGLVVRLRPECGWLSPDHAAAIAALSASFGNGLMDVTSRANLQLRGVAPDDHPVLIAELDGLGLLDRDAGAEARRNIILSPFAAPDGPEWRLAQALARGLSGPDAPAIPGKFGFSIAALGPDEMQGVPCDIRISRVAGGWQILPDGGDCAARAANPAEAAQTALALTCWFLDSGGVSEGRGRMAAHLARGHRPPMANRPGIAGTARAHDPGPAPNGWLVALPFGQIDAAQLAALAQLGPLRLTPWRMLLIEGLRHAPDIAGLILDPADPLRRVQACTGAPGCPQARAAIRDLARELAPRLPPGRTLHLSGCAKGCACPGPADLTLIARDDTDFDLIRAGRVSDPVAATGLSRDQLTALIAEEYDR